MSRAEVCFAHPRIDFLLIFFFQAEDGIRDLTVTGVQTCALPIFPGASYQAEEVRADGHRRGHHRSHQRGDRKSTRLNSSHSQISYAVFCLKKKKKKTIESA